MSDYICYRCNDEGGDCCSTWCFEVRRWWFIRCPHRDCWVKNGKNGLPPGDQFVPKPKPKRVRPKQRI